MKNSREKFLSIFRWQLCFFFVEWMLRQSVHFFIVYNALRSVCNVICDPCKTIQVFDQVEKVSLELHFYSTDLF
jgi:hypothetical protein